MTKIVATWEEQLHQHVMPIAESGCLVWTGRCSGSMGYGVIRDNGKDLRAHRCVWEIAHGPIPKHIKVCHSCDVPSCVRLDHLFLGTQAHNMQDASRKGKLRRSANTREKMSRAQKGNQHCRGRVLSLESREKISASNRGQKRSLGARQKMRESAMGNSNARGHTVSAEARLKISRAYLLRSEK